MEDQIPQWLTALDKRLKANAPNPYAVGDKMTIADFALCGCIFSLFVNEGNANYEMLKKIVDEYEGVRKYYEGMKEELKGHLEARFKPRPFWAGVIL